MAEVGKDKSMRFPRDARHDTVSRVPRSFLDKIA